MTEEVPRHMSLKIVQKRGEDGVLHPCRVTLDGVDLTNVILSDGISINWKDPLGAFPMPEVSLTFAADALDVDLDFDVEKSQLVKRLFAEGNGGAA